MLYCKKITVYRDNCTKHVNTLCEKMQRFWLSERGGICTYSNNYDLEGYYLKKWRRWSSLRNLTKEELKRWDLNMR